MDEISTPDYEFGGFRLDTALQALVSPAGEPVPLPSRAFDTLRHLVEHAGELIEKADLMRAVWPKTVVEENNLNQCILTLRRALGEEAGERRFILTVPGRGFKFVAPVTVVPHIRRASLPPRPAEPPRAITTSADSPAARDPRRARSSGGRRRWTFAAVAATLVAVAGAAYYVAGTRARPLASADEYEPLTDLAVSATAPALSADGRLLAFISGGEEFLSPGHVWLKVLPDGEPIELVRSDQPIFAPTFTADGTHVAYSVAGEQTWDTWVVPITGGAPVRLLPNASSLRFIGAHEVMYSEFKTGIHLGIVASLDDRSRHREIYLPAHERAMAHYSYLSPDRRSVLVVEMTRQGGWDRCRLVPFDGSSTGRPVGPDGGCLSAAWSPDGRWMYFAAKVAGRWHLWRQRFPDGAAEQITFGPTDERTVTVAPDGRSLLTSLGRERATIWLHDAAGERALTTETYAESPKLSADGRHAYFLAARSSTDASELWRLDVATGRKESLLAGFAIMEFSLTRDEQQIVFTTTHDGVSEIWAAPADRHASPVRLLRGGDEPAFDATTHIFYRRIGTDSNHLHRMNGDGSDDREVFARPILDFDSVAPDGRWAAVALPIDGAIAGAHLVPIEGGEPRLLAAGWWPSRWSWDGRFLYAEAGADAGSQNHGRTVALPIGPDGLPVGPLRPVGSGAIVIPQAELEMYAGPDPGVYVFVKGANHRNIYRIPLRF